MKKNNLVFQHFLDLFENNREMASDVAFAFCEQIPVTIKQLKEAFTNKDNEQMKRGAHQLKGSLGYLGFTSEALLFKNLENDLRNDTFDMNKTDIDELCLPLEQLVKRVGLALSEKGR